jgi:GST-like protein
MIDVYYWPTVNGRKVTIMLEETGLPYKILPVDPTRGATRAADFLRINPNGKIPAIVDDAPLGGDRLAIFESAVILQYLAEKSGQLMPADLAGRYEVLKWLAFQAANIGPMMGQFAHFHDYARENIQYAINRYGSETERLYGVLERRLAEMPYLAGATFSIADIATWTWIMPARQEQRWTDWPNLKRWHDAVGARPGVIRGNAVRLDLQGIGAQRLDEEQWQSLYGWQQAPRR